MSGQLVLTPSPSEPSAEERRQRFRELLVSGVGTTDAGELVGYTAGTSREYRRRDRAVLREMSIEAVSDLLPVAVKELAKLLTGAQSEAVRLNAIQRVLSQSGLDVPTVLDIHALSDAEIDARLHSALGMTPETIKKPADA